MKKLILNLFVNGNGLQKVTVTCRIIIILAITSITLNTAKAQTYDPHDVEVINNLIKNNDLQATPNAPETWDFATWSDKTPKQIIELRIYGKYLSGSAVFDGLTALQRMDCSYNYLSKLDVTDCTQLQYLNCSDNPYLSKLDATGCIKLQYLSVISCAKLEYLSIFSCGFTNIDLAGLYNLTSFSGKDQYVPLTLYKNKIGEYTLNIYLNNPTFTNNAISYSDGILKCIDNTLKFVIFTTETHKEDFLLEGTMWLTYSEESGINEPDKEELKIYLTNDKLFIECDTSAPFGNQLTIKLYDMLGKEVLTRNANMLNNRIELNINHLVRGSYIVNVFSAAKLIGNTKIVK